MKINFVIAVKLVLLILILLLCVSVCTIYKGNILYYLFFTLSLNILLYFGFDKNKSFFELFIGLYFWLGYWLKYSLRNILDNGLFDPVGAFDLKSGAAHDRALLISSLAACSILLVSFFRRRFFNYYKQSNIQNEFEHLLSFYRKYRSSILTLFVLVAIIIPGLNAYLGIYQRGTTARTVLPFGLNGIFTWLVFFGLSSLFAVILDCEMKTKKGVSVAFVFIGFFEILTSNFSMLSRGMFLNGSALIFGINANFKKLKINGLRLFNLKLIVVGVCLMGGAIFSVEYFRSAYFNKNSSVNLNVFNLDEFVRIAKTTRVLLVDRWVGIEGVMAISSYDKLGLETLKTAWHEKYQDSGTSWFDRTIIESPYKKDNLIGHHFITLSGVVGFLFYSGNYYFLIFGMIIISFLGFGIEYVTFRFGGNNLLFCSLMSQVIAYRFIHFGYVPAQSYLLFGTVLGNIFIFFCLNKLIKIKDNYFK